MPITPEQARAELARRELARRQGGQSQSSSQPNLRSLIVGQEAQGPSTQGEPVSKAKSFGRGAAQGATLGFGDEIGAAVMAVGSKLLTDDPETFAQLYRGYRDVARESDTQAREQNPKSFIAGEVAGGLASSPVSGGPIAAGAKMGLGMSSADLTDPSKENLQQAAKDTALGAAVGGVAKAVTKAAPAALGKAKEVLRDVGQSRLFKAAVGINKRAFTQMNGKGLLEKAGQYLDDMGIGLGDTTESIAQKLAKRRDALGDGLESMVTDLDRAAAGKVTISPADVANKIEKEVAIPLRKLAASRAEYKQVMGEVKAIRNMEEGLTFADAAAQRRAAQQQVNYNVRQGADAAAEARRKIAQIWNDVIDDNAQVLLRRSGKAGDAYRAARQEFALVQELLGHAESRVAGNRSVKIMSPSNFAMGGISGVISQNPFIGIAGAAANHLANKYGNAAAGRAAINMAKMAAGSQVAARNLLPSLSTGATAATVDEVNSDE